MAFESNFSTFIGNLTGDPELRYTQSGVAVCTIRLANNRRWQDRNGNEQEDTTYINVVTWRDMAENIAESFSKGDRAIAIGKLKVRSYENKDGHTVWVTEIEADEVAPSLRWAKASLQRTSGNGGGQRSGGQARGQQGGAPTAQDIGDTFQPAGGGFDVDEPLDHNDPF